MDSSSFGRQSSHSSTCRLYIFFSVGLFPCLTSFYADRNIKHITSADKLHKVSEKLLVREDIYNFGNDEELLAMTRTRNADMLTSLRRNGKELLTSSDGLFSTRWWTSEMKENTYILHI